MANDHRVRSAVRPPLQVAAIFRKVCQLANHDDSASSQLVIFTNLYICDPEITEIKGRRIALVADEGLDIGGWKYRYCPPLGMEKMEEKATFHVIKVLLYRSIRQILIIDTNFCACFSNNPSFGKGEIKKRKIGA